MNSMNLINTLSEMIVSPYPDFLIAAFALVVICGFTTVVTIGCGWLMWLFFDCVKEVIKEIKKLKI